MKLERTVSRRQRRVLCAFAGLAALVFPATLDAQAPLGTRWISFAVFLSLFAVLVVSTRRLAFRSAKTLDEREVQLSLRAYQHGYAFAIGIIVGSVVSEFTSFPFPPFALEPTITVTPADLVYWLTIILVAPTFVIAWTEPDPPAEEVRTIPNA